MKYLTHPAFNGDDEITVASHRGPVHGIMREGVLEWPDDVETPIGFGETSVPPAELVAERKRTAIAELMVQAAALGLKVEAPAEAADQDGSVARKGRGLKVEAPAEG